MTDMKSHENDRRQRQFANDLDGESELADASREWQDAIAQAAE